MTFRSSSCPTLARASPRPRSCPGRSRSATRSRSTTSSSRSRRRSRWSSCPVPTRESSTACSWRRGRPCRSGPRSSRCARLQPLLRCPPRTRRPNLAIPAAPESSVVPPKTWCRSRRPPNRRSGRLCWSDTDHGRRRHAGGHGRMHRPRRVRLRPRRRPRSLPASTLWIMATWRLQRRERHLAKINGSGSATPGRRWSGCWPSRRCASWPRTSGST